MVIHSKDTKIKVEKELLDVRINQIHAADHFVNVTKKLAEDLSKLEDTAAMDFSSKYGTFNFKEQCIPKCTNCKKWDTCCGDYPERFPYNSDGGEKQCCGQKTYYKSVLQCCPGDRLQPYGTCSYG